MSSTTEELRRQFSGRLLAGRYRLDELVGHGGMGAVFRATDERLERQVAVKVILVENTTEPVTFRQRFTREARMAARIQQHPNVVTVHDFGTDVEPGTGHQLDYIVMELLRGESLAEWLPANPAADMALLGDILTQAARGVAAGHRAGVIHRDVKPRNLIVLPGDGVRRVVVRVVDFGIAKPRPGGADISEITVGGGFVGSARYASPEQLQGQNDLGPESDVFSLGVLGYELLAGSPPFTEADRTRLSQSLHVPLRPPTVLNPAVPGAVENVLLRCLELSPGDRFADADALATALEEAWRTAAALDRTEVDATVLRENAIPVEPPTEERRRGSTTIAPARWRPGVRTWVAAAAATAVIALGALASGTGMSSMSLMGFLGPRAPRDLFEGTPVEGSLGRRDSTLASGGRFDVYRYRGLAGEPLTLTLASEGFEGTLEWGRVRDGRWEALESSGPDQPGRVAVTVPDTAEYRVRVQASRPEARGRYTITVARGTRAVSSGADPVASRLGPADARLADGIWHEEWTFRGSPGQQVNVTVDPDTFAARIEWGRLSNGAWEQLEEAVSDGSRGEAQLTATPQDNGEYRIRVRNRRERQAGHYTLRVATGARKIHPGTEPSSHLSVADAASGGASAEVWAYRGAAGEPVTLTVRGSLSPVLEWGRFADGRWVPAATADGSDTPPRLRIRPPSGDEYFVRVRGSRTGEGGRYTLSAVADPPSAGVARMGESVQGTLAAGDPRLEGKYYEEWFYSGTPGQEITIIMESGEIDPVLTFGCWTAAGLWEEVDRNDDSLFSRDAMIVARVRGSGECAIRAASYYTPGDSGEWAGTGGYTLRITGSIAG
jgi:serine/threonine protein kinase